MPVRAFVRKILKETMIRVAFEDNTAIPFHGTTEVSVVQLWLSGVTCITLFHLESVARVLRLHRQWVRLTYQRRA